MPLGGETELKNPQPGGREPAPGQLALVQAFVNSNYDLEFDHGAELLDSPAGLQRWLVRRGLVREKPAITETDLQGALAVRESLRALLIDPDDGAARAALNEASPSAGVKVKLDERGPRFEPSEDSADGALALILAHAAAAMLDGTWSRLKACKECSWAFYDHSRNGAGSWCSMKVCGGRVKQRAHYRRTRGGADQS